MKQFAEVSLGRSGIPLQSNQTIEKFYTPTAVLLSAISVPFYEIANLLTISPIVFIMFLMNPLIISGTGLVIYLFSMKIYKSQKISLLTALFFSLASFVWPYNSSFFTNPLVGLLLISSMYYLYKGINSNAGLSIEFSGFLAGLIVLAHPAYVFLIPIIISYGIYKLRKSKVKILKFLICCFIAISIQGMINHERTGSFTNFGYGQEESLTQDHKDMIGLAGLLFSPGKGIFIYYPLSILFPISMYFFFKKKIDIGLLLGVLFFISYIFFGTINDPNWGSLGSWGPRYLVPLIPLISVSIGILLLDTSKLIRITIIFLSITGFIINLLGKLIWYMYGLDYGWSYLELWKVDSEHIITWTWQYSPIALHYGALTSNYFSTVQVTNNIGDYHIIGLLPCRVDLYLYCNYGLGIFLIPVIITIIIFYYIWRQIRHITNVSI